MDIRHELSLLQIQAMLGQPITRTPTTAPPLPTTAPPLSHHCPTTAPRITLIIPANTGHSTNAFSMLAHRLRRWPNIETALGECPVFAGMHQEDNKSSVLMNIPRICTTIHAINNNSKSYPEYVDCVSLVNTYYLHDRTQHYTAIIGVSTHAYQSHAITYRLVNVGLLGLLPSAGTGVSDTACQVQGSAGWISRRMRLGCLNISSPDRDGLAVLTTFSALRGPIRHPRKWDAFRGIWRPRVSAWCRRRASTARFTRVIDVVLRLWAAHCQVDC